MLVRFSDAFRRGLSTLFPGYFALVMATGILSIAVDIFNPGPIAWVLFGIAVVAYILLWFFTFLRMIFFPRQFVADLTSHTRGPGFLTLVASTCIVGSEVVLLSQAMALGALLWGLGVLLWVVLIYVFLTGITIREPKPNLETGLTGGWLVIVVSTQSISVLGVMASPAIIRFKEEFLFFSLAMFLLGCALYILIISLIFYRLTFFPLTPAEFQPPYWINMGALAITTLAGSALVMNAPAWSFLADILPFLKGFTLFFWVIGTWWIPLLIILELWRYVDKRFPIRYDPRDWDIIFPLGMYTVCTYELARATGMEFLAVIAQFFIYLAFLGWIVVAFGLVRHLVDALRATETRTVAG